MHNISQRLHTIRKTLGLSQGALAARLKFSRTYISLLERGLGDPSHRFLEVLGALESDAHYFSKDSRAVVRNEATSLKEDRPFEAMPVFRVPVVSWAQAGEATAFEEIPLSQQEAVVTTCEVPNAFAVTLRGDSMEPKYSDGDIAVVMPGVEARNGCLVIAKLRNDGIAFKIYNTPKDEVIVLSSYNPAYYPTEYGRKDFHWIYPVHSVVKNLWRH